MNVKSRNKVTTEFNMSSMTDLIFLLLIFFMLLSTMVKQNQVMDMNLPKSSPTKSSTAKVVVSLDKNMVYRVNKDIVTKDQIEPILKKLIGDPANPEAQRVEIAMDESIPHQYFVELVDIISVQGKYKISIQTSPK